MTTTENSGLEIQAEKLPLNDAQNNNNNNNNNQNGGNPGDETSVAAPAHLGTTASQYNPENKKKDLKTITLERLDKIEEKLRDLMYLDPTPEVEQNIVDLAHKYAMFVQILGSLEKKKEYEPSSNDSAGKQPRAIPLEAYPSFNPWDWKSKVVTDVANASVKNSTVPCTSFANFVKRFEDVLIRYDRNVQTDWYECLCQIFSISKYARWFDRCITAGVGGKNHTWKKAKQTMKSNFDVSAKSSLSWVEYLKEMKQDETEKLLSFADRFLTALMGANVVPSEQNKLICMLFFVSLMPMYREQVSDRLKQAYKKGDRMEVDNNEADCTYCLPTSFAEMQDFCVTASDDIEAAVQEFKHE